MADRWGNVNAVMFGSVDGVTVTTGAASANQAIPNDSSGNRAKQVMLVATGNCYVKFGKGTPTATTNSAMLPANNPVIVSCAQFDNIAHLQETAAAKLSIIPLET